MPAISQELDTLTCKLIEAAGELLAGGEDVPVLVATDCDEGFASFEGDTPDGCYGAAQAHVRSLGKECTRYALLYAGVVQEDESAPGMDALVVEFAERGMECAWSGYILYRTAADGAIEMSDPQPAGAEETLF